MTMVLREKAVLFDLGYLEEERVVIYLTPSNILINICINVALKSEEKVFASFKVGDGYFTKKTNFRASSCFRQVIFFCIPPLLEHGFQYNPCQYNPGVENDEVFYCQNLIHHFCF